MGFEAGVRQLNIDLQRILDACDMSTLLHKTMQNGELQAKLLHKACHDMD